MIANEKEFDETLQQLSDLYEEGKQHLYQLQNGRQIMDSEEEGKHFDRLYLIIREMRDMAAGGMQKLHFRIEN